MEKLKIHALKPGDTRLLANVLREYAEEASGTLASYDEETAVAFVEEALLSPFSFALLNNKDEVIGVVISIISDFWYSNQQILTPALIWVSPEYRATEPIVLRTLMRLTRETSKGISLPLYIETIRKNKVRGKLYKAKETLDTHEQKN